MVLYFLIRWSRNPRYYTVFAPGISIFYIPYFHECEIALYVSADKYVNLTPRLVRLQRRIRQWLRLRRWYSNPRQLRYREVHGRWPPIPRSLRHQ